MTWSSACGVRNAEHAERASAVRGPRGAAYRRHVRREGVGLSVPNFESDTHTLCGPVYRWAWFHSAPISKLRAVIEGACST